MIPVLEARVFRNFSDFKIYPYNERKVVLSVCLYVYLNGCQKYCDLHFGVCYIVFLSLCLIKHHVKKTHLLLN